MGGIIMDKDTLIIVSGVCAVLIALIISVATYCIMVDIAATKAGLHQDVVQTQVIWVK